MIALWPRRLLAGAVRAYQLLFSAWIGPSCRFEPTCSNYALAALQRHGALVGTALTVGRFARCGPWCDGGRDDVPHQAPRLFRHLSTDPRSAAHDAAKRHARPQP